MAVRIGWVWLVASAGCWTSTTSPATSPPSQPLAMASSPATKGTTNRVQINMGSEAELLTAGFKHIQGGTTTFANGTASIDTKGYEEWAQDEGFVQAAANGPWAVEARLSLDLPCSKPGTGFWIHDGRYYTRVGITDHEVVFFSQQADIGRTDRMRTYRIEERDDTVTIRVDGKQVLQAPALENLASVTLMFGVLGDGCAQNASTWDYLAYETAPGPGAFWPPRTEWHPGATAQQLTIALAGPLPATARAMGNVSDRDAPCIALLTVDGAVRDLLPLAYDAQQTPRPASQLRQLRPLTNASSVRDAERILGFWTDTLRQPVCDPAPGSRCGPPPLPRSRAPVPPTASSVRVAVTHAEQWSLHPVDAVQSTANAAQAYADAVALNLPGADAALKRLEHKLVGLAQHPRHCGL